MNINDILLAQAYSSCSGLAIENCIKSVKLFKSMLGKFSLKRFSVAATVVASIKTEKYTLDEFLASSGDFKIASFKNLNKTEYWLKCTRNGFAFNYSTLEKRQKNIIRKYDSLYSRWAEEYEDNFANLNDFARYCVLKEL